MQISLALIPLLATGAVAVHAASVQTDGIDDSEKPPIAAKTRKATGSSFPATAHEYARMVAPVLGVPPQVDLSASVEIPLFVDGERAYGNLGRDCDNPSYLGKATVSGSTLQRYEGRTADGTPLPDVVWVAFGRNSSESHERLIASVQMIGYHRETGATAFFESSDQLDPWVTLDEGTLRMRGVLPWIDDPEEFDRAFVTPGSVQCVACHQSDPFITNSFINAAKIPGTDEPVIPILDDLAPYYVVGGETWDMRTLQIEDNACFDCHRVGMSTVEMFLANGWHPDRFMPPHRPGSLREDWEELLAVWQNGPESVDGAEWIVPPAKGEDARVVGDDYPHRASFNAPGASPFGFGTKVADTKGKKAAGETRKGSGERKTDTATLAEVERLLKELKDPGTRKAFEGWIEKNGVTQEVLDKLRSIVKGGR